MFLEVRDESMIDPEKPLWGIRNVQRNAHFALSEGSLYQLENGTHDPVGLPLFSFTSDILMNLHDSQPTRIKQCTR